MEDGADADLPDDAPEADEIEASGAEVLFDPAAAPEGDSVTLGAPFMALLRSLRALPGPCAPPVGEGAFDILYASAREIVVWFISAKDGIGQKEVAIPTRLACKGWEMLLRGEPVDESALRAIAAGPAGGRWLLALFAQLPTVEVRSASTSEGAESEMCVLVWRGDAGDRSDVSA